MVFIHSILLAIVTGVLFVGVQDTLKASNEEKNTKIFALIILFGAWIYLLISYVNAYGYA